MSNGHQLELAIKEATEKVAKDGWEAADTRLITLAGFGYLAHEIRNAPSTQLRTLIPVSFGSGGIAAGLIELVLRLTT